MYLSLCHWILACVCVALGEFLCHESEREREERESGLRAHFAVMLKSVKVPAPCVEPWSLFPQKSVHALYIQHRRAASSRLFVLRLIVIWVTVELDTLWASHLETGCHGAVKLTPIIKCYVLFLDNYYSMLASKKDFVGIGVNTSTPNPKNPLSIDIKH